MPSWKKVIVSGSNAELNDLSVAKASGSFSGSYQGDGSSLTAVTAISSSTAILAQTASVATRANALAATVTAASASTAVLAQTASVALTANTASVATRANGLAPTVTASQADDATTASFASTGDGLFSGSFSGSFQGDGSSLSGIATTLTIDADSGGTSTVALSSQTFDIAGTSNEIETTVSGQTVTVGLPNDVTIGQDITITRDAIVNRNLTVQGTASFQNTTDLDIADRFIRLASGSNAVGEGGFVVQQGSNGRGVAFAYDVNTLRFGSTSSFDATQNLIEPDTFFVNVVEGGSGDNDPTDTVSRYTKKGNLFVANNGDIYIYS